MRFVAIILAVSVGGCSALFMEHPDSSWQPPASPRCSETQGPIVLDVILAIASGIGGAAAIGSDEGGLGTAFLLSGAAFGGSALKGSNSLRTCRDQHREHEAFVAGRGAGDRETILTEFGPESGAESASESDADAGAASESASDADADADAAAAAAADAEAEAEAAPEAEAKAEASEAVARGPRPDSTSPEREAAAPSPEHAADVFWSERPRAPGGHRVIRGVVVHLENGEMYFNLGKEDRLEAGDSVRIKHPVKIARPGGAGAIEDWLPIGAARVTAVGRQLTMARLSAKLFKEVKRGDLVEVLIESDEPGPAETGEEKAEPSEPSEREPLPAVDEETTALLEVFAAVADRPAQVRAAAWERFLSEHPDASYAERIRGEIELLRESAPPGDAGGLSTDRPDLGSLDHRAPPRAEAKNSIDLVFVASDPDDLLAAWLYYRRAGQERFQKGRLERQGGYYLRGEVPADEVAGEAIEYFVEVVSRERGVGFGAGAPERPLAIDVEGPELSEAFGERRNRSRVSASAIYLDYATFDDRGGDRSDNVFMFETDFFYRLYSILYGVRAGFGVIRGEGGFADSTDPEEVGFNFGFSEVELRGPSELSLIGRMIAGVGEEGFGLGFAGRVRLGPEDGNYLSLGVQNVAEVGFLSDISMQWAAFERVPIGLTAAVTDQPTGGDLGVRLTTSIGWRVRPWIQPTLYLSYQGRSVVHSGVGGGFGLVFDW